MHNQHVFILNGGEASMNKLITRRNFLRKTIEGTLLITTGGFFTKIVKAMASDNNNLIFEMLPKIDSMQEGQFPFYKYIHTYNFGDFIPKDQGGKFIQMELLGTEDDHRIVNFIKNGLIEKNMGTPPDWAIFESSELEKSVWFNRFYYLPSFARLYYLDKNTEHLEDMMKIIKNWIKENPMEGPSKSKYNWFDMQVAWRSIHLSWCYYLGGEGLSEEDKKIIYGLQAQHAHILMNDFGKKELNEFNHQSHGALAILYLAILFPELPDSKKMLETGLKIIQHHVDNAFYDDGGNVEQMFGYYPFMSSIIRDAYLLCKSNGVGDLKHSLTLLSKMYLYLSVIAQPDNTVPPINDSYDETVTNILPTLADVLGKNKLPKVPRSKVFTNSQIGVIRSDADVDKQWYINMNAAKLIGSHDHAGRLAVNLWYNGKPILVDSGCCNYDNPLLVTWYRTSEAHNTVIIDKKSDFATSQKEVQWVAKRYTENKILELLETNDYKFCRMVSPASDETNSGVKWTRNIALIKNEFVIIQDCFESENQHCYEAIFRHPDIKVKVLKLNNSVLIDTDDYLVLQPISSGESLKTQQSEGYYGSKNIKTPTTIFQTEASGILHTAYLLKEIDKKSDLNRIQLKQKTQKQKCEIIIADENNKKMVLVFDNDENSKKPISIKDI